MTVFVISKTDGDEFDYSAASRFGRVSFLFDESFTGVKRPLSELITHAKETIGNELEKSPTSEHFLIVNRGPLLNNAIAAAIFSYRNGGFLSLLVFNPTLGEYSPVHLQIEDDEDIEEPMKETA